MRESSERVGRYGAEVVGWLRRWLVDGGRQTLLGSWTYAIKTEDVTLEERGDDWVVVIRFRLKGDARRYGFVVTAADEDNLRYETPDSAAQTIVILLDEAILTRELVPKPDDEGVVWLR